MRLKWNTRPTTSVKVSYKFSVNLCHVFIIIRWKMFHEWSLTHILNQLTYVSLPQVFLVEGHRLFEIYLHNFELLVNSILDDCYWRFGGAFANTMLILFLKTADLRIFLNLDKNNKQTNKIFLFHEMTSPPDDFNEISQKAISTIVTH